MLDKFFRAHFLAHFAIWFAIIYSVGLTFIMANDGMAVIKTLPLLLTCICVIIALAAAGMMWVSKQAIKYYERLAEIVNHAKLATTEKELLGVRVELIEHWGDKSFHQTTGAAAKEVLSVIDTRLVYEFKNQELINRNKK